MNILILTLGTRGDVQPYIALGLGLGTAGHAVTLASDAGFAPFVAQYGLRFAPLDDSFTQLTQSATGKAALAGKGRLKLLREVGPMLRNLMNLCWNVASDVKPDLLLYHSKQLASQHIAEKLKIPAVLTMAMPTHSPTREFANPVFGGGNFGGALNRLTHLLLIKAATKPYGKLINAFRAETLGLGRFNGDALTLHGRPIPRLYGYSEHVLPRPADWDDNTCVSGYWFLPAPAGWQPSRELSAFLDSGAPPVYIGFGSMSSTDPARDTQIALDAARDSGQRVILATGWGALDTTRVSASDAVFPLDNAPHDWLFPRCAAVVHHGGAGTTAAGLRAGKPTVIVPFFGDQPFWGKRIHALGAGPAPIPHRKLTAPALSTAIRAAVADPGFARRAQTLAAAIGAEDGSGRAARWIVNATTKPSATAAPPSM